MQQSLISVSTLLNSMRYTVQINFFENCSISLIENISIVYALSDFLCAFFLIFFDFRYQSSVA